nr:replication protein A 70 kDa DNA-binding subunit B-like [Ipomoea batatas]
MVLLSSSLRKSSAGHCPYLTKKMSMLYVLAKDINPQCYKKAIRLRLIRTYIVTEGRNKSAVKSQECLFHDIEFSHLLKEGKVYAVKNFVAVSYYYQYKTTQHKYMMRFNQYTTIERHRRKGFPNLLFRIKPIHELLAGKVEEKLLIVSQDGGSGMSNVTSVNAEHLKHNDESLMGKVGRVPLGNL